MNNDGVGDDNDISDDDVGDDDERGIKDISQQETKIKTSNQRSWTKQILKLLRLSSCVRVLVG